MKSKVNKYLQKLPIQIPSHALSETASSKKLHVVRWKSYKPKVCTQAGAALAIEQSIMYLLAESFLC